MIDSHKFTFGDITISIKDSSPRTALNIPGAYLPFSGVHNAGGDISLRLHYGGSLPVFETKVFESPPIWSLYRDNNATAIKIFEHMPGYGRTLVLSRDLEKADLHFDDSSGPYSDPFFGPTLELLMVHYLAQGRGVIIHGCGIKLNDRGVLFVGESGAGKTTMARIWDRISGVEVLSDDRTIVRKRGDHFVMYGTPWYGQGKFGCPSRAKLDQIFFIKHGKENSILKCNNARSVTQFLKSSFPPLWDTAGMEYSMDIFSDLAAAVPCHELSFKPDNSVIDFVDNLL